MDSTKTVLSDKEQKLLSKFFDGECGYFGYRRAKRLLERKQQAHEFLGLLDSLARDVRITKTDPAGRLDNMWERVSARIEAEERSQLLLGKRQSTLAANNIWGRLQEALFASGYRRFGFSAGLVAAASVIVFLSGPYSPLSKSSTQLASSSTVNNASGFGYVPASAQVEGSAEKESYTRPQLVEDDYQRALEVDWVRSRGRVKFIQDPRQRSVIIWVKKREPRVGTVAAMPELKPTVLSEFENQLSAE